MSNWFIFYFVDGRNWEVISIALMLALPYVFLWLIEQLAVSTHARASMHACYTREALGTYRASVRELGSDVTVASFTIIIRWLVWFTWYCRVGMNDSCLLYYARQLPFFFFIHVIVMVGLGAVRKVDFYALGFPFRCSLAYRWGVFLWWWCGLCSNMCCIAANGDLELGDSVDREHKYNYDDAYWFYWNSFVRAKTRRCNECLYHTRVQWSGEILRGKKKLTTPLIPCHGGEKKKFVYSPLKAAGKV